MLHLIVRQAPRLIAWLVPAPVHRQVLNVVHRIRRVWWRYGPGMPDDCRVLVFDAAGRVLLVRHSYGTGWWMLPGGGAKRGEDPVATATRELREETGCGIDAPAECAWPAADAARRMFVVVGAARGTLRIDGREIVEAGFYPLDALPAPARPGMGARLARWLARYREAAVTGIAGQNSES